MSILHEKIYQAGNEANEPKQEQTQLQFHTSGNHGNHTLVVQARVMPHIFPHSHLVKPSVDFAPTTLYKECIMM